MGVLALLALQVIVLPVEVKRLKILSLHKLLRGNGFRKSELLPFLFLKNKKYFIKKEGFWNFLENDYNNMKDRNLTYILC